MELRQLEQFVAVADERHFTRAAARCGVSQSSLSATVRALERELDAPLLFRTTRRVELTEAGRALLAEARRTLAAAEAAREAVEASKGRLWGPLSIGGVHTEPMFEQPRVLASYWARHPEVELRYRAGPSVIHIADVRNGSLDAAFVSVPAALPYDVQLIRLFSEPLALVCRHDHPLAGERSVSVGDLRHETFIGAPAGVVINAQVERALGVQGDALRVPFVTNDPHTMLGFVAAGLGVSFLPASFVEDRPSLRAVALEDAVELTIGLVIPPPDRLTSPARALVALVEEELAAGTLGDDVLDCPSG